MLSHRIKARRAADGPPPQVERDEAIVSSFLSDAAHVPGGFAAGVAFPRSEAEVASLVAHAPRVLAVGAQSSLTGGATPRGDVVMSTRALSAIGDPAAGHVRVGAGVPLTILQRTLAAQGLYYPPVPTFDGAFVGGTIATNAAGAATFKHGSTRRWVAAATIVLANGDVLDIVRGQTTANAGWFELEYTTGDVVRVPVPRYAMPEVPKLSAGYFAKPGMDLLDLFIGAEGTLGVVTEATLAVVARPRRVAALIRCANDRQAVTLTSRLREEAILAWSNRGPLDVAAIEFMDARALRAVPDDAFARAGVVRPSGQSVMLLLQIEVDAREEPALDRLQSVLESTGIEDDPHLALSGDDRGAERLFNLRESVPAGVNAIVAVTKQTHPDVEKTAGDMIVPFERLAESIDLYRRLYEERGLDYAIWGHVSDGNLHPNVVPHDFEDVRRGREAILEMARQVVAMGGAPLAEHGVGRSALKQQLLRELYGDAGIEEMRAVKRAIDPGWKLAPGVLFRP